jgi:hypothetical protein
MSEEANKKQPAVPVESPTLRAAMGVIPNPHSHPQDVPLPEAVNQQRPASDRIDFASSVGRGDGKDASASTGCEYEISTQPTDVWKALLTAAKEADAATNSSRPVYARLARAIDAAEASLQRNTQTGWVHVESPPKDGHYIPYPDLPIFSWAKDRWDSRCYRYVLPPLPDCVNRT